MDNILIVQSDDYLWLPIWRNAVKAINAKHPPWPHENRIIVYNSFLLDYNAEFISVDDQRWYIIFGSEQDKLEFQLTYG